MNLSPDSRARRIQVAAEQRRLDHAAELEIERGRLALQRQKQIAREQAKRERQHTRAQKRAALAKKISRGMPTIGRRVMIVGPILAPMAVAWIGQIQFATGTLHWWFIGGILFAAAWELTTAFAGWMYHQARQDGDRGSIFRIATWLFAASAGGMNYWHALGGQSITHPTPKAVSYGAMSLVGIALWELYASLIHRQQLRAKKLLPDARPRFGVALWLRYPRVTWTAWSLSIRDRFKTTDEAWAAAVAERAEKAAPNNGRPPVRVSIVAASAGWQAWAPTAWTRPPVIWDPAVSARRVVTCDAEIEPNLVQSGPAEPAVRTADTPETGPPVRTETVEPDRSGSPDSKPDTDRTRTATNKRTRTAKKTGPKKANQSGPKTRTGTDFDALLEKARTLDEGHVQDHGRHISADNLRAKLRIGKGPALELVKRIRFQPTANEAEEATG